MRRFADLLDSLVYTPGRNTKRRLIVDYCRTVPDPDRGFAIAALTRDLQISSVKPAMIRGLIEDRMDPTLFRLSYDYVGDLAETVALAWPAETEQSDIPTLGRIVQELQTVTRSDAPGLIRSLLDRMDASARYALLKLVTGALRVGVTARLAKQALADFGGREVTDIEELWHGLDPPYESLFAWLEGRADRPVPTATALFRPAMLANPIGEEGFNKLEPDDYAAEWKWDGIRVQLIAENGTVRLYSRTGDDISAAFPDIVDPVAFEGAIDGELLVAHPTGTGIEVAPFGDLQRRLNRKTVSAGLLKSHPAHIRAYDYLHDGERDLRPQPFRDRRRQLEDFISNFSPERMDLSELVPFADWSELADLRSGDSAGQPLPKAVEGLMLKRWDSSYVPGRPKGPWFKWKRDPHLVDAVLMYAQRGHGKRSSYYSDYTFGLWRQAEGGSELVPVGKAYFGFTDDELRRIDRYVRDNTVERFGPVRSVRAEPDHGLVLEIAYEGLNRSTRHKSGVAMRFPRISRLRWDKPPGEADQLSTLLAQLDDAGK